MQCPNGAPATAGPACGSRPHGNAVQCPRNQEIPTAVWNILASRFVGLQCIPTRSSPPERIEPEARKFRALFALVGKMLNAAKGHAALVAFFGLVCVSASLRLGRAFCATWQCFQSRSACGSDLRVRSSPATYGPAAAATSRARAAALLLASWAAPNSLSCFHPIPACSLRYACEHREHGWGRQTRGWRVGECDGRHTGWCMRSCDVTATQVDLQQIWPVALVHALQCSWLDAFGLWRY